MSITFERMWKMMERVRTMSIYDKPNHADANIDRIEHRKEEREYRNAHRDELHLGRSLHSRRLKNRDGYNDRERVFARHWMKERRSLSCLLSPYPHVNVKYKDMTRTDWDDFNRPIYVTKRDAEVAFTIIPWLGSNGGFHFIETALRECGYKIVKS